MYKFLIFTLFVVATVSCSPNINTDDNVPVIENLKIVNLDSAKKYAFYVKTNIQFSANFVDDQELGSYKFDIHFAGDGHKHPNNYDKGLIKGKFQWDFTRNGEVNGAEHKVSFNNRIELRDDKGELLKDEVTSGPYHCVVYSVDEAGNSSVFVQDRFLIVNDFMPLYTITEPDFEDLKVKVGGSINLVGSVYGVKGVSKLSYIIRPFEDTDSDDVFSDATEADGTKIIPINTSIVIPTDAPLGNYIILLLASDKVGNVGEYIRSFEIIE